jgi:hypothetical protein
MRALAVHRQSRQAETPDDTRPPRELPGNLGVPDSLFHRALASRGRDESLAFA